MAEFAAHGANQEEKMAAEKAKKTIVIGHKNPDTDSICSAIGYANFKTLQTGGEYVPCRAGELNPETTFVLDYFKVAVPKLIKSVKTQVKDIEIRETPGVSKNISLRKAWNLMQEDGLVTLPAVTDKNILEGLITVGDITRCRSIDKQCSVSTHIIPVSIRLNPAALRHSPAFGIIMPGAVYHLPVTRHPRICMEIVCLSLDQ